MWVQLKWQLPDNLRCLAGLYSVSRSIIYSGAKPLPALRKWGVKTNRKTLSMRLYTLRLLGCCRTSMTCLRLSSLSLLLLYSSWLVSSVWCWVRISSARAFWIVPRCRNSSSCIDSWCLSSMACSRSFCVCRLFSSWKKEGKRQGKTGQRIKRLNEIQQKKK